MVVAFDVDLGARLVEFYRVIDKVIGHLLDAGSVGLQECWHRSVDVAVQLLLLPLGDHDVDVDRVHDCFDDLTALVFDLQAASCYFRNVS